MKPIFVERHNWCPYFILGCTECTHVHLYRVYTCTLVPSLNTYSHLYRVYTYRVYKCTLVPCVHGVAIYLNYINIPFLQGERPPVADDPRPTVTCTFVTEFEDHIFVTVDAEAFFFLHDLISSYVKVNY